MFFFCFVFNLSDCVKWNYYGYNMNSFPCWYHCLHLPSNSAVFIDFNVESFFFLRYDAGDHVAVLPSNNPELVERIGQLLEIDLDTIFTLNNVDGKYFNFFFFSNKTFEYCFFLFFFCILIEFLQFRFLFCLVYHFFLFCFISLTSSLYFSLQLDAWLPTEKKTKKLWCF